MSDWYYAADNVQKGPINESELKAHFATNQLPTDTLVWKEGMENWAPANQVPAFSFRPPPTPAKVQPSAAPDAPAVATAATEPGSNPASTTPVDVKSLFGAGEALEVDAEDAEKNKVFGILAYVPLLFWVPLVATKDSPFAKYHANQGLVLFLVWIATAFVLGALHVVLWTIGLGLIGSLLSLVYLGFLVLVVLGIINAAAGKCVPLPLIGGIKLIK